MAEITHYSHNVLSEAARGEKFPTLEVTQAFTDACRADRRTWTARWHRARTEIEEWRRLQEGKVPEREESADWLSLGRPGVRPANARFAEFLRTRCLEHKRPMRLISEESGVPTMDIRGWLNGGELPESSVDLAEVLRAFQTTPGSAELVQKLYAEAWGRRPARRRERAAKPWASWRLLYLDRVARRRTNR